MIAKCTFVRQSNLAKTLICVDRLRNSEPEGLMWSPFRQEATPFCGMFGMVKNLEALMDQFSFPEPTFRYRTFRREKRDAGRPEAKREVFQFMSDTIFQEEKGDKATFVVQVQFRQNATWQGTIQWLNEKKTQKFRSTLEMIKLMDEALAEEQEKITGWVDTPDRED